MGERVGESFGDGLRATFFDRQYVFVDETLPKIREVSGRFGPPPSGLGHLRKRFVFADALRAAHFRHVGLSERCFCRSCYSCELKKGNNSISPLRTKSSFKFTSALLSVFLFLLMEGEAARFSCFLDLEPLLPFVRPEAEEVLPNNPRISAICIMYLLSSFVTSCSRNECNKIDLLSTGLRTGTEPLLFWLHESRNLNSSLSLCINNIIYNN